MDEIDEECSCRGEQAMNLSQHFFSIIRRKMAENIPKTSDDIESSFAGASVICEGFRTYGPDLRIMRNLRSHSWAGLEEYDVFDASLFGNAKTSHSIPAADIEHRARFVWDLRNNAFLYGCQVRTSFSAEFGILRGNGIISCHRI